jgi:excisionase family DNA binding protein
VSSDRGDRSRSAKGQPNWWCSKRCGSECVGVCGVRRGVAVVACGGSLVAGKGSKPSGGTLASEWEMHVLGAPADGEGMGRASRELQPLVFTPDEVAELLCVSRYTVYRLIEQGEIPTVRIGRLRRVRKVDLERWMEEHLSSAS